MEMQNRTETLEIGSRAPEFSLPAANREGSFFTLSTLLGHGPVDCGIFARHLVTELREAHGPV